MDEHAKRKRDERETLEKQAEGTLTSEAGSEADAEAAPPKKIKPEAEAVSQAEVKQIRRNLKTMPLEDNSMAQDPERQNRDMDDAESDQGSTEDTVAQDKQMEESSSQAVAQSNTPNNDTTESTPSSDIGDQDHDQDQDQEQKGTTNSTVAGASIAPANQTNNSSSPEQKTTVSSSGFSKTSAVSPFGHLKAGESVFGSSSSTLKGLSATSDSSPFAAVAKTNVFDAKPSSLSGGFGNTSAVSPFATMASQTNVFGSGSSSSQSAFGSEDPVKSVFGSGSSKSSFATEEPAKSAFGQPSGFGSSFGNAGESTAGSVFGAKSIVGSVGGAVPTSSQTSSFKPPKLESTSGSFGTFGSKQSFLSKESSFASGSFIGQDNASQSQEDFGSLLSQDVGEQEGEYDPSEEVEHSFGAGVFSSADQIDVQTGEEDEMNIYQTKGKLYADTEKTHAWKERGKGTFKVNVSRKDTKLARLVMRTDGVLRLILNVAIFPDMNMVITGDKYVRFIGIEDGKPIPFLLKVKDATVAEEVVRSIDRAAERQARGKGQGVVLKE
ncbi:hypothetical protein BGX28_006403 [Mortierella sp. GBA30]|nr:hypothetical protein BGX28_006403 [Mortierella sp. GBA30]